MQLAFRIMGLAGRLLSALGIICLLLGLYLMWRSQGFAADAIETTGRVVSYHEIRDGDSLRYRPRVRFRTMTGSIVTIEGQLTTTSMRYAIGTEVPVVYPGSAPTTGRLATYMDNWFGVTAATVIGLIALAAGVFIRRAVKREATRGGA